MNQDDNYLSEIHLYRGHFRDWLWGMTAQGNLMGQASKSLLARK